MVGLVSSGDRVRLWYRLWAMGYGLWYGLWAMGYGLWYGDIGLGYGLWYGLWAMVWGSGKWPRDKSLLEIDSLAQQSTVRLHYDET